MRLQGYSHLTNHLKSWRDNHNKENVNKFIHVWQPRDKKKPISDDDVAQSSQEDEDEEQEEELVLPTPFMAYNNVARDPISYPWPSSSTVHMSTTPEQTSWQNRTKSKPTDETSNDDSSQQAEEDEEQEEKLDFILTPFHENVDPRRFLKTSGSTT